MPKGAPHIAIIVAMTSQRVIGHKGKLPWSLPDDLQNFKRLTMGNALIMGRKTHESIGRPLSGRPNIVLSRSKQSIPGVIVCDSLFEGIKIAGQKSTLAFVIGGEEVYRLALPIASELHISWVHEDLKGDTFFPEFDLSDWQVDETIDYTDFRYSKYQRRQTE